MHIALPLVGIVVVAAVVAGLSERYGRSAPLLLVVVGAAISFIPGIPRVEIDPDLVLFGFLPPLLYSAAIRTSLIDFRANRQAILLLSVGLVAFTTATVGLVAYWVVPSISLAAAFAIGAVVAPPDAVAATAVARRIGLPRKVVTILEGESLVNDATALVAVNAAVGALTQDISVPRVGLDFLLAAGGGIAMGIVVAIVLGFVRKHIDNPVLDTTLSFVAPFAAFLPAEEIHASGVLSVVVTGLILGHKSPVLQSAASRVSENINWRTIAFLLESIVFLLIGLQIRGIVDDVRGLNVSLAHSLVSCLAILAAAVVARIVWVFSFAGLYRVGTSKMRAAAWGWPEAGVISWAGMRGVVTLAAVFLLPADHIPQIAVLRLAALVVVAGTLLGQGFTLPWLIRRMHLPGPDPAEDALQTAALVTDAGRAGLKRLEEITGPDDPAEVLDQLRDRSMRRTNSAWERLGRTQTELEPPSAIYRRLRLQMLAAERESIIAARDSGLVADEVLRSAMAAVDVEESLIDRVEDAEARLDNDLVAPPNPLELCEHLADSPHVFKPNTPGECSDCLAEGLTWVHLRMCLTCGQVACCDSSVGNHATNHFRTTEHPVMRSVERGEAWRWCYVDEMLG
jgi:CPA1 family monovalent cation:H+ antiporter